MRFLAIYSIAGRVPRSGNAGWHRFRGLIGIGTVDSLKGHKVGTSRCDGALGWMQQMVTRAQQNLNKLSCDYDPALGQRNLAFITTVEPRQLRAQRIVDRLDSATFLANSDAFAACLGVRRQLKDSGVAGVDDNLSDGLNRFFNRTNRAQTSAPATPQK